MYRYHAKYFLLLLFIVITTAGTGAFAQTSTVSSPLSTKENSPYSRFGIGEQYNSSNATLQGMGNIGSAYESPYQVNTDNPASYSFLKLTSYEGALQGNVQSSATNYTSFTTGTATISYLNIGVPVGKHAGISFGFKPYTHMYYNLADTVAQPVIGNTQITNSGSGSVNYAYIGGAYQYKGLSLGFNFGYMFGNMNNTTGVLNIDTTVAYSPYFTTHTNLGGLYWKGGIMYEAKLSKDMMLRIGGTLAISQTLNAQRNEYWIGTYSYGDTLIQDTAYNAQQTAGKVVLPATYSFGIQLARADKWNVGIDYTATKWSQFTSYGVHDDSLNKLSYTVSLGGSYTPNKMAIHNYLAHITYRLGFYYGVSNVYLRNTSQQVYGVTFGGSFPFRRTASEIHTSFDIGRVGTMSNDLIRETYVRFTLGFSFNDKWFVKSKYE